LDHTFRAVVALVALLKTEPGAAGALPADGRIVEPNRSSTTVLKRRFLETVVRRRALGANAAAIAFNECVSIISSADDLQAANERVE